MKTVIIIGANGFIGRRLSKTLTNTGHKVIGVSKNRPPNIDFHDFYEGYNYEISGFNSILKQADAVVFCAGHMRPSSPFDMDAVFFEATNVLKIARQCAKAGVEKFLMTSSGGTIYGHVDTLPIKETIRPKPSNPYGYMHLTIENGLRVIKSITDLTPVSLRVGNAYGPGQTSRLGQGLIPTLYNVIKQGETFKVYGDGLLKRDYVFIDDIVSFYQTVIEQKTSYLNYNVGSGIGVTTLDAIASTEHIAQAPIKREHVKLIEGTVASHIVLDISRAKEDLGWTPHTTFETGLEKYLKWADSNNS